MKFAQHVFDVATKVSKDAPAAINTRITLEAGEVPDDVVAAVLVAGNSPRVAWQNRARQNGIPQTDKMTWAQWLGAPRATRVAIETPEQIRDRALNDPELKKKLLEMLLAEQ